MEKVLEHWGVGALEHWKNITIISEEEITKWL